MAPFLKINKLPSKTIFCCLFLTWSQVKMTSLSVENTFRPNANNNNFVRKINILDLTIVFSNLDCVSEKIVGNQILNLASSSNSCIFSMGWLFQSFHFVAAWQRGHVAAKKLCSTSIVAVWQRGSKCFFAEKLENILIILNK